MKLHEKTVDSGEYETVASFCTILKITIFFDVFMSAHALKLTSAPVNSKAAQCQLISRTVVLQGCLMARLPNSRISY